LSFGLLLLVPVELHAAPSGSRMDPDLLPYFLGLAAWVTVAVVAVLLWPIYVWLLWMRRRKDDAAPSGQPRKETQDPASGAR
jgi:hypothetical protein